jgi:L-asparaginase II
MGSEPQVLAHVIRSGLVESRHHGSVVALDADGGIAMDIGATDTPMFPRSANKLAQAAAMVEAGLDLPESLLALAAASHSGERFHVAGARQILAGVGLDEGDLQNTPALPLDPAAAADHVRTGGLASSITADCSGKHAAMLVTCVINGWSTRDYLDPAHPVQQAIVAGVDRWSGRAPDNVIGVDGCGAPLVGMALTDLARMFGSLATAAPGSAPRRVVEVVQNHPEYTSGTTRDEARLIRGVPGIVAKAGAEGVIAAAFDDGRAIAVKLDDGTERARSLILAAALRRIGVDAEVLDSFNPAVLGGGHPVGRIQLAGPLDAG